MSWCWSHDLKHPVVCDKCQSAIFTFQDKQIDMNLTQGEVAQTDLHILKDGKYPIYSFCRTHECRRWVTADAVIENHVFTHVENVKFMTFDEWEG